MPSPYKTDLKLVFKSEDQVDLALGIADLDTVSGLDNLVQALRLRLMVDKGELVGLGHPDYGSRVRELLGVQLDPPNLELLRRYVRQTLLDDWRVKEVTQVAVLPRPEAPGSVDVVARVTAVSGEEATIEAPLHAG